jgi:4-hydroxy-2-oxoheptanedioate aldolase
VPAPHNPFKAALLAGKRQVGLWLALANAYTAEIAADSGFDWLLIDSEHAPNHVGSMLGQLQAVGGTSAHPVIRVAAGETWMIKQVLDIGAQTILVPVVESADQARQIVAATRYAPEGNRGIGAALARASRFNAIPDYIATANKEICLLIQVETCAGLRALDALLAVTGIDGIFVGPADLAADMGFPGQPTHPEVQAAVIDALKRIIAAGRPSGILSSDPVALAAYFDLGVQFVAVGSDVGLLTNALKTLRTRYPTQ